MLSVSPPLSLYIHFPWCIKKCPYCDFNSHTLKRPLSENEYIEALITDLDSELVGESDQPNSALGKDRKLISIFMGGGTPSLFSAKSLTILLDQIHQRIAFDPNIEITLEANPGTLEHDNFEGYLKSGINRLSLGVQSFDDGQLKTLGRIHDSTSASQAIQAASSAGFDNFNIDLMYGLPGQSAELAIRDCMQAISHSPTHLSFYQLTIEPNTYFHQFPPSLPDNDLQFEIQTALQRELEANDYSQYEVSAYSRAGRECRHNINYWEFGDYLGIGAGAHSKLSFDGRVIRSWKQKHPQTYMTQVQSSSDADNSRFKTAKHVIYDDLVFEIMMNSLRLKRGISLQLFEERSNIPANTLLKAIQPAIDRGWVEVYDKSIRCTDTGYLFIDEILQDLLPDTT